MRTTRRYLGCCTSRCTSTTIVFCIFALVTLPVRTVLSPRSETVALCVSVVITPSLLSVRAREPVFSPAPDLSSLHEAALALPLAPSKAGSAAGKSSPSNPFVAPAIRPRPLRGSFQYAAASLKPSCAGYEFRGNRQLVRRQPHGFLSRHFVHSRHFKHDASRLHDRHPLFRRAFALAHARFGRLLGERLVRKNPDPQFSAALDEPRNRHARRFDLPVGDPRAFHGLQTVLAERQISAAPGLAVAAAAHLLSVLHFLRHQHRCVLASLISLTASRLQPNSLLFPFTPLRRFRVPSESLKPSWARFRPGRPSTSRRSPRKWCWLPRCRNRCPRAAFAVAAAPAGTIPCARFPRRSAGPPRAP